MATGDELITYPGIITETVQPLKNDSSINVVNLFREINNYEKNDYENCIIFL